MSSPTTIDVELRRLAHGRAGDKGDRSNLSVIAWRPEFYALLVDVLTENAVARVFAHRRPSRVQRHLLPWLNAMNFVLDNALDGGVNDSLNLDTHGKALAFLLLGMRLSVPIEWLPLLAGPPMPLPETDPGPTTGDTP